jgi:hypothetical protein
MTMYPDKAPPASLPLQHRPENPFQIEKYKSYPQVIHRSEGKLSTIPQFGFISCHSLQMRVTLSDI